MNPIIFWLFVFLFGEYIQYAGGFWLAGSVKHMFWIGALIGALDGFVRLHRLRVKEKKEAVIGRGQQEGLK